MEENNGTGEWQSKLALSLREDKTIITNSLLFAKRRKDVSFQPLVRALNVLNALEASCILTLKAMQEQSNREDYAKEVLEKLNV